MDWTCFITFEAPHLSGYIEGECEFEIMGADVLRLHGLLAGGKVILAKHIEAVFGLGAVTAAEEGAGRLFFDLPASDRASMAYAAQCRRAGFKWHDPAQLGPAPVRAAE